MDLSFVMRVGKNVGVMSFQVEMSVRVGGLWVTGRW